MYAAETNIDVALGICIFVLYSSALGISLAMPIMMEDDHLGPSNTFFVLSGFSIAGAIYVAIFIRETLGLTDKEKKTIFMTEE